MEQGTGEKLILKWLEIKLIQNSWRWISRKLLHFFWNQAKSEDREYSHTGLVFAAILAISSLIPIAGGAILHVVRRSAIHLISPFGLWLNWIYVHLQAAKRELLPVVCDPPCWYKCLHSSHDVQLWGELSQSTTPSSKWNLFLPKSTKKPSN